MPQPDHTPVISDNQLLSEFRRVFGEGNIFPGNHREALENSITLIVHDPVLRSKICKTLTESVPGLFVIEGIGGFVRSTKNKIGIVLGSEQQRSQQPDLNAQALNLIRFLEDEQNVGRLQSRESGHGLS